MKLSDVSTHIGSWAFRQLAMTTVEELLAEMDKLDIARAAVCNTHSILYKNSHRGNTELFEKLSAHAGRLFGVATLNPFYINAIEDLEQCSKEYGFKAVRLVPRYDEYLLTDSKSVEFAKAAGGLGMSIMVPNRIVDFRQRHWMDVEATVELDELVEFAKAIGDVKVIGTEFVLGSREGIIRRLKDAPNLLFGISRTHTLYSRDLPKLIEAVSNRRFLFASGMGFKGGESALLRLAALKNVADVEQIGEKNFTDIFC